jgi:hypothetical protein
LLNQQRRHRILAAHQIAAAAIAKQLIGKSGIHIARHGRFHALLGGDMSSIMISVPRGLFSSALTPDRLR